MKYFLIIPLIWASASYAQCVDYQGKKTVCPTEQDSLDLYQNAETVSFFYENNPAYMRTRVTFLKTNFERNEVYRKMEVSRKMFSKFRENQSSRNTSESAYKDISFESYYRPHSTYTFFQRELENQIINSASAFPLYDVRIAPLMVVEYACTNRQDPHFGDLVNVVLYAPIMIKPVHLLNDEEKKRRSMVLSLLKETAENQQKALLDLLFYKPKKELGADDFVIAAREKGIADGLPIYYKTNYGSGSIIGFMKGRIFYKLRADEYLNYAVPMFARQLLADETALYNWVRQQYGTYFSKLN
ncbi:MAG: hypothetical protein ACKO5C_03370 [Ferruginibacter sp.]